MPPSFRFFFASSLCGSSNVTYQRLWKIPTKRWNSRPLTVCFRSLLIGIEEKRKMIPSLLLKHTQFLTPLQPYSSGNYPNFFFFLWGTFLSEDHCWRDSAGARWTASLGRLWSLSAPSHIEFAHISFLLSTITYPPSPAVSHGVDVK